MTKHDMARGYLTQVKCALSHQNYGTFTKALRSYKETENLPALLDCLREIFASDPRMHSLFRGLIRFPVKLLLPLFLQCVSGKKFCICQIVLKSRNRYSSIRL